MAQELKALTITTRSYNSLLCYDKDKVDAVLAEKDKEIAELKDKLRETTDNVSDYLGTKKELQNVNIGKTIDKHTFKICEAVALGLTHYYMGPNDKRELTKEESEKAKQILPSLPCGWLREFHDWDACNNYK